jgi:hypothetical protein
LEMAIWRRQAQLEGLVHHSDRGSPIAVHPLHRAPGRGRCRHLGRHPRRLLRQRAGRDDHRAVQDRADPPARPVEGHRRPRVRHLGVGRLVQPPPAPGAHWPPPTGRVRGRIPETGRPQLLCSTQATEPPMNPGRIRWWPMSTEPTGPTSEQRAVPHSLSTLMSLAHDPRRHQVMSRLSTIPKDAQPTRNQPIYWSRG